MAVTCIFPTSVRLAKMEINYKKRKLQINIYIYIYIYMLVDSSIKFANLQTAA